MVYSEAIREVNHMDYTINKLAKMAGVSTRTLRFYEEMGLLVPVRVRSNGYRIYGQKEIDLLQQILFYRELSMPLEDIKKIVSAKNFDCDAALKKHLTDLRSKRDQLDALIINLEKTIQSAKGERTMKDEEKFEGFKQKLIEDNEERYGAEVREKYGEEAVNSSNAKLKGMTKARSTPGSKSCLPSLTRRSRLPFWRVTPQVCSPKKLARCIRSGFAASCKITAKRSISA
jgi:DNA-binding transcriptional MerR regulator